MSDEPRDVPAVPIVTGPTGGGKTALVLELKERLPDIEVISADSRQVYRRLDIGTAKPTASELALLPHHLIDIIDPTESYSAGAFREDAERALHGCFERGVTPVVVGGTGFYLRALTEGLSPIPRVPPDVHKQLSRRAEAEGVGVLHAELERVDPTAAAGIEPTDTQRILRALAVLSATGRRLSEWWQEPPMPPVYRYRWLGLRWDRARLRERIAERTSDMLHRGLRREVAELLASGLDWEANAMRTVGYREWRACYEGSEDEGHVADRITTHTAQYAKRQMTWFSSVKRIEWFDACSAGLVADAGTWLLRATGM